MHTVHMTIYSQNLEVRFKEVVKYNSIKANINFQLAWKMTRCNPASRLKKILVCRSNGVLIKSPLKPLNIIVLWDGDVRWVSRGSSISSPWYRETPVSRTSTHLLSTPLLCFQPSRHVMAGQDIFFYLNARLEILLPSLGIMGTQLQAPHCHITVM